MDEIEIEEALERVWMEVARQARREASEEEQK